MIKICHITPFFNEQYGGTERFVNSISKYQQNEGLDVTILTTTRQRTKVGKETHNGIEVVRFFSFKDIWKINPVSLIIPYLIKSKFDIIHIHSHLFFTSNQATFIGRIKNAPSLLHLHGGVGHPPYRTSLLRKTAKAFYDKSLGKFTISCASMVGSVSKNDLQRIKSTYKLPDFKLAYLPNAVDVKSFSRFDSNQKDKNDLFTILYIGDLEPWKGIHFLEKWIKYRRKKTYKKIKFRFIGQGSFAYRLNKLENSHKNGNIIVEYLGEKPHDLIPKYLAESQALILPSYWEGLPTVVLEAMAAKVPVLATPVGDIPQIVQSGRNGLLFNRNYKSLDKAIEFLNDNPKLARKIGNEARRTIMNEFTVQNAHEKLIRTYKKMINGEKFANKVF